MHKSETSFLRAKESIRSWMRIEEKGHDGVWRRQ